MVLLAPALAHAQTNLDQGKSAAQIFASDCAECHKAARGLANGKNSAALTDFLREHYTTSRDQAAALANYVLGGRGGETGGAAAQGRGQKPAAEHASAAPEEPKPEKRQGRPRKPEEGTPANAKPRPNDEAAKPAVEATPAEQPSVMFPETRPAAVSRAHRKEPKASPAPAAELPAAVAHAPAAAAADTTPTATATPEASPNAPAVTAAPAAVPSSDGPSGEPAANAPVSRDDVPD